MPDHGRSLPFGSRVALAAGALATLIAGGHRLHTLSVGLVVDVVTALRLPIGGRHGGMLLSAPSGQAGRFVRLVAPPVPRIGLWIGYLARRGPPRILLLVAPARV